MPAGRVGLEHTHHPRTPVETLGEGAWQWATYPEMRCWLLAKVEAVSKSPIQTLQSPIASGMNTRRRVCACRLSSSLFALFYRYRSGVSLFPFYFVLLSNHEVASVLGRPGAGDGCVGHQHHRRQAACCSGRRRRASWVFQVSWGSEECVFPFFGVHGESLANQWRAAGRGFKLSFETPKSESLSLFHLGERAYDHVILFPSKLKGEQNLEFPNTPTPC